MKRIYISWIILAVVLIIWSIGTILVVNNLEEPSYSILETKKWYEIREYSSYIVAEVEIWWSQNQALNNWFRLLAGYIFWWNTKDESITMTAPVNNIQKNWEEIAMTVPVSETITEKNTRIVQFSMPSKYTLETLPVPNNERVKLKKITWYKAAVLNYTWYATENKVEKMKNKLVWYLNSESIEINWDIISAQYNPPLSFPFLRRNEIIIPIK